MEAGKKYITQISGKDLTDIAKMVNAVGGKGVKVNKDGEQVMFSIDEQAFKMMVWAFLHNGGMSVALADIDSISLDPAP